MRPDFLAAALVVRDEAAGLPGCLESLAGVVDTVRVYDTGSVDTTPQLAAALGATVTHGRWTDDFGAARNAAERGWTAEWVLTVDADHRCVVPDPARLRVLLADTAADVCRVEVAGADYELPYLCRETLVHRVGRVHWSGRVRERLVTAAGAPPPAADLPAEVIRAEHRGYRQPRDRIAKAVRNAGLARRTLAEATTPRELAPALLDMGRHLVGAALKQDAVNVFEEVRGLFPGTPQWLQATDFLARLVLAAGMDDICLGLSEQLREAGAPRAYCDWLAAQARAQLGDAAGAAGLLHGVTEVIDPAGRRLDPRVLRELGELVDRLAEATSAGPVG